MGDTIINITNSDGKSNSNVKSKKKKKKKYQKSAIERNFDYAKAGRKMMG
tara:strand:- start:340 stop:489 length:150 start_codon:yes stop_codon:yes gene_type:complete